MSKKGLTINQETGQKILVPFIDDSIASVRDDIAYSGKFVNDNLLSVSHESHLLGDKIVDETGIDDSFVLNFNKVDNKLEYTKVENIITEIDCGYF